MDDIIVVKSSTSVGLLGGLNNMRVPLQIYGNRQFMYIHTGKETYVPVPAQSS